MSRPKIIGVIPARFESTRLPGKVLLDVAGKPLLYRVYAAVRDCSILNELLVATDSPRVAEYCARSEIPCSSTGQHHSGTDRLHEVLLRTDGDIYVNIQGDEPTVGVEHLRLLVNPLLEERADVDVSTLCVAVDSEQAADPNVTKVVFDKRRHALYFSRLPVPYYREQSSSRIFFKHIGLYAYRRRALERFHQLPPGDLEQAERLEQLRFLENGIPIAVAETRQDTIGVDTPEDLERAIRYFQARATRT
jgi:3-deoxy-manno-octulosonate cytidylyltransferase (CMP-KDO synthetase)